MDRDVLEARAKFEAESAKDRMRVVEEVVSTLRERHDSEMREDVDMPIAEKEGPLPPTWNGVWRTLAVTLAKSEIGTNCEDDNRIKSIR